ncbi:multicopper oxidase domain-containing protein [Nitriliruptoria bacterium AS10]|nr:multicopper oxidase domain-containing protein [Salsipaludibacter albus]
MRPNATERWRVLNGSVDGKGFRRLMVLRGRFGTNAAGHLVTVDADGNAGEVVTRGEVERAKVDLHQLALDGVTLVSPDGTYQVRDLAQQGAPDAPFPLDAWPTGEPAAMADAWAACFADGDSLRACYVRPNEVYLGPANRTDVFFQAPPLPDGQDRAVYSVVALGVVLHADTPLQGLQQVVSAPATRALDGTVSQPSVNPPAGPGDVVIATVTVTGEPAEPFDLATIDLPDVPPYLRPITDDDPALAAPDGGFRTRVVTYSGWGSQGMPLVTTDLAVDDDGSFAAEAPDDPPPGDGSETAAAFAAFVRDTPDLEGLRWVRRHAQPVGGRVEVVLLPPNIRTMAIDGRKFDPTDPGRPRMHLDSAEEWVVQNVADGLWGPTGPDDLPTAQYAAHYDGVPMSLADGMARFRDDPSWQLLTRAVDHPFHIHQNPFWVIRIDVPDATGNLHNILDQPRWMDVVPIPRHRGRVVFRSRFPDFVGTYVNHCHILLHEDNGMMQAVEVTPFDRAADDADPTDEDVARANYAVRDALADPGTSPEATAQVGDLYGRPDLAQAWVANMTFEDPNESTGQSYPGFDLTPPPS